MAPHLPRFTTKETCIPTPLPVNCLWPRYLRISLHEHHSAITLTFPEPDIALLTLDLPGKGANVLSRPFLAELREHFVNLGKRTDLAGLIIASGKPGVFIAGADITEFVKSFDSPKSEVVEFSLGGRSLFEHLAKANFVSVAAIDGLCLGGGAELALQCDRRLFGSNPKAQFGFPEVKLGIFPGWGGTVRAPALPASPTLSNCVPAAKRLMAEPA